MLWLRGDHPDSTVENWLSIIILQITAAQPQQPPLEPTYGSLKMASEAKVKGIETGITLLIVDIKKELLQFENKVPDQTAAAIVAPARNSNSWKDLVNWKINLSDLGTVQWRRWQIFTIFDPYPPPPVVFTIIHQQIWQIFDPFPITNCRRLKWMVPLQISETFVYFTKNTIVTLFYISIRLFLFL